MVTAREDFLPCRREVLENQVLIRPVKFESTEKAPHVLFHETFKMKRSTGQIENQDVEKYFLETLVVRRTPDSSTKSW